MKKIFAAILSVFFIVSLVGAGTNLKSMPFKNGQTPEKLVSTYKANTTDTVIVTCDPAAGAVAFSYYTKDSSNITSVVVQRVCDGKVQATIAGDTLASVADSAIVAKVRVKAFVLAPVCDQYYVLVKYKRDEGAYSQAVKSGSNVVIYQTIKQFYK